MASNHSWKSLRLEELVREIVEDSSSGAAQLTIKAANLYLKLLEGKPSLRHVRRLTKMLAAARPSMPSIANIAYRIERLISEHLSRGMRLEEAIENSVRMTIGEYQDSLRMVVQNSIDILSRYDRILVHSYSSTVARAIEECGRLRVYVTESRPGYEGRTLAERLARKGLRVTLLIDAAAAYALEREMIDAVVIGCDAILDDCSIANKVGSKMIALAAKQLEIPVNVITDLWKIAVQGFSLEEHSPEEVYAGMEKISVLNPYFEIVPSELISIFITEEGKLDKRQLLIELEEFWRKLIPEKKLKRRGLANL